MPPPAVVPPVMSTCPPGSEAEAAPVRASAMAAPACHVPVATWGSDARSNIAELTSNNTARIA